MRRTDNGATPRPARAYRLPEDGPRPDLPLYERLIDDGIATADEHVREGHQLWPHIQGWAAELGLTGPDAVAAASQLPRDLNCDREPDGGRLGREAAD